MVVAGRTAVCDYRRGTGLAGCSAVMADFDARGFDIAARLIAVEAVVDEKG